jgi:hypothetical protein
VGSATIHLNGYPVEAFVLERAGGVRVEVDHDDWVRLRLAEGRKVPLRLPGRADPWVTISRVTEIPPFALLELR